jgi:alkylhydroperoxidase family enzyme
MNATAVLGHADPSGTGAVIRRVLRDHPDVVTALEDAHRAAWGAVDPRLLELCRIRTAQLLGCGQEEATRTPGVEADPVALDDVARWPSSPHFDDRDRAVLAWCEQYVIDVASMDDTTVAGVRDHLGEAGLVDLTNAFLVIEQRQRLRTAWERLFGEDAT